MDAVQQIDQDLLLLLNDWGGRFWDLLFLGLSHKFVAIPLYALLAFLIYRYLGWKKLLLCMLAIAVLITISDQTANLFKKVLFLRPRPCHNPDFGHLVSVVKDGCGGRYGFYSAHAANTMALAVFVGLLLKKHLPKLIFLLLFWAATVAYSRVYLGVHYVSDVMMGMFMGAIFGGLIYWLSQRYLLNISWVNKS